MVVVKEKERLKKRRYGVVEAQREEIRKLLNQGNVAVAGLKKEVTDLKAQLAQARSEGGGSRGELEASKAEARKLQREVEELKARLQAQGGGEVEEEEVGIQGEEGEEGEEESEEEEDEESDGENE